ncbi:MAG: hypothetical protein NPIRA04_19460 [Nitrospirales bacterium]|nr:MAG: hypothetical protein NPIRA04_19460 [Nitrospirales bacterium]
MLECLESLEEVKRGHMQQILIVDDYESGRHVLRVRLEMLGYHCHEAGNGAEALSAIRSKDFDLVITDHNMPVMTGLELLQCLAERPETQRMPVIFVTGQLSNDLRDAALRAGALAILEKPYEDEELMRAITGIFNPLLNRIHTSTKQECRSVLP